MTLMGVLNLRVWNLSCNIALYNAYEVISPVLMSFSRREWLVIASLTSVSYKTQALSFVGNKMVMNEARDW